MRSSPPDVRLRVAGVVPAAGRGERLGGGQPKALRLLGGLSLLERSVRVLAAHPDVELVVVAAPSGDVDAVSRQLHAVVGADVRVVAGGASRQESVRATLDAIPAHLTHVLVHDAARPLVPDHVVDAVIQALAGGAEAVIPVVSVVDTMRLIGSDGALRAIPRAEVRAVQTPQGFLRILLNRAHQSAPADSATDDASLAELMGVAITAVPGSSEAFKITTAHDLLLAEAMLADRSRT